MPPKYIIENSPQQKIVHNFFCEQDSEKSFFFVHIKSEKKHGYKYQSLPLAHSMHLKEDYNSKTLLDAFKYDE